MSPNSTASMGRRRLVLLIIGIELGQLLTALDQTIVGTAAPRILADLNGFSQYAWIATAYLLTATVMMPIYGKLSDMYGRRLFFLGGMVIFLAGSALAGASQSMEMLIIWRAAQGIGGGAIMPIVSSIIGDVFPPAERGKWQGVTVSVWGIASILGPPVGGWITDAWGWRWIFYVNMPVGAVAFAITAFTLQRQVTRQKHRVDYVGVLTLAGTTTPLLLAFSWAGAQYAWDSPQIIGLLAGAVLVGVVFVLVERHAAEPILQPGLFRNSIFTVSVIATFVVGAALVGSLYFLPLFVQGVIGQSAAVAGEVVTPIMVGVIISSVAGGFLMAHTGRYKILALVGFAIAAIGMFLLSRMGLRTSEGEVVRDMFVLGLGIGVSMTLFSTIVQNAFPRTRIGEVTAATNFFREIGGAMGLAILGSVMTNRFVDQFQQHLPPALKQAIPAAQLVQFENPQLLLSSDAVARIHQGFAAHGPAGEAAFQQLIATIQVSLSDAVTRCFLIGALLITAGFLATLFLREIPLRKRHESGAGSAAVEA
ncbi:MAG TPA: MDR family MFS transporter [Ktedonobacterales bacterium]|nr:MDR family MFS transporter [Ktedonobacterales bacterium]